MTNSSHKPLKTNQTDTTYSASNEEFLKAIYGELTDNQRGMTVSFSGSPHNCPRSSWAGTHWAENTKPTKDNHNNYFSLASFKPNKDGQYNRQKKYFSALHAIMLDDIGTKATLDKLSLKPSWIIETSQDNYQVGFILRTPITDTELADKLMKAIIDAGLCDPGAGGPTTRLARLPVAINGKCTPLFKCKLIHWQPNLKYSAKDFISELSLNLDNTKQKRKPSHPEQTYVPCPEENPIIQELKNRGLYKGEIDSGKHNMTCPWVNEHTDKIDDGAAYFEPNERYHIGGFKCHHGHCEKRDIHSLLEFLEIPAANARMKPIIRVQGGELHNIVDRAEQELAKTGDYYQRGSLISTIIKDKTTNEMVIKEVKQAALAPILSRCALWQVYDSRKKDMVLKDPPERMISALVNAPSYDYLPTLRGLAHQPYLSTKGQIIKQSNYNEETSMFGVFSEENFNIPNTPSKEDAMGALKLIMNLLTEFPFAKEEDKSAALSAILTATIRPSLELSPMYHIQAPQISSGKSYLCELISLFASNANPTAVPFPQTDEECRKQLLAILMRGPATIMFDNLTYDIDAHDSLCTILTSPYLTDRILGISKTTTVSTRTLFLSNGNNVGPIKDMTRRCNVVYLDPACEMPATREFKNPNPVLELKNHREKYVSAALTIIQAWITAERPKTDCPLIASFTEWSNYCRQPLLWLGLTDPATNMFKTMSNDPERELLGQFLKLWHEIFDNAPTMVRDVLNHVQGNSFNGPEADLQELINEIALEKHHINRKRLGIWIKRNSNKIVDGLKFTKHEGKLSAAAWKVQKV